MSASRPRPGSQFWPVLQGREIPVSGDTNHGVSRRRKARPGRWWRSGDWRPPHPEQTRLHCLSFVAGCPPRLARSWKVMHQLVAIGLQPQYRGATSNTILVWRSTQPPGNAAYGPGRRSCRQPAPVHLADASTPDKDTPSRRAGRCDGKDGFLHWEFARAARWHGCWPMVPPHRGRPNRTGSSDPLIKRVDVVDHEGFPYHANPETVRQPARCHPGRQTPECLRRRHASPTSDECRA